MCAIKEIRVRSLRATILTAFLFAIGTVVPSQVTANAATTPACVTSSGSWVNSALPQAQTGTFELTFDATPASTDIDGTTGVSSGPAGAYTSLAAIIRFNSTGTIDAMNGTAYTAATPITYTPGTTYHFILDINKAAHTYNAYVVIGGVQMVIGSQLAFRTQQAAVSSLNDIGSMTTLGSEAICNVAVTTVPAGLSITTQPISQSVTAGQTATFSVAATGTAPLSYQWRKNGAAIGGATSSAYTTPATVIADNGALFTVVVTNSAGSATSNTAALTVIAAVVAPSITTQPVGQSVTAGQTATFSVVATGTAPLSYQWRKNGAAIGGATSSVYLTPATVIADNGALFTAVVTNSAGSATSNTATLVVTSSACTTSSGSWVNSALPQAQTGTFELTFDATPASTDIDGTTGVSSGPAGAYTSLAAIIRFNSTGTIDAMNGTAYTAATPITYTPGTTYHFILDINKAAHTYNAYVVIGGVQMVIGSQLAFRTQQAAVSSLNDIGSMTTLGSEAICNVAVTTVPAGLSITTQPISQSVTAGQTATFSVAATGTAPLSYQWSKNGAAVGGATLSSYVTPATVIADNGALFTAVVTNSAGSATSKAATLTVIPPVIIASIITQPVSQSVTAGQTATFSVAAAGTTPLSYQWRKNGAAIGGATSSVYLTPATVIADNGALFTVVVTNSAGSATSNTAALTVIAAVVAPSITTQPVSQSVTAGQTVTFSVAATGTAPLSYQWSKNGAAVGGATSSVYLTPATVIADNGALFTAVVTNSAGSATSNSAALTVIAAVVAPSITTQPASQSVTAGQTATFSVADTGTAPLTYQWSKNGAAVGGATSSAYVTPATVIADNGALFAAVVTNSAGSATSNSATLMVIAAVVVPSITTQPVSQSVMAGQTASFSVAATGTAPLSYQWSKNGAAVGGATSPAYITPAAVIADSGALFTVVVTNSAGSATSNSATLTVKAATVLLNASPTQLSFGSVNVSSNSAQGATLTNAGNSNVTISNVIASGAGFSAGGGTVGLILTPGQTAPVTVTFAPLAAGNVTGSITVVSNSPTVTITLSGTGLAQASHSVSLSWTASPSEVIGYNIYSGGVSGGPYAKLNASPTPGVDYVDASVQSAQTYYYVVTAVGSNDSESAFSTEVKAVIP